MTIRHLANPLKLVSIFFAFALAISFTSCKKNVPNPNYRIASVDEVMVEAENSTVDIEMRESEWVITGVYSIDGYTLTDGNKPLQLEGLGTLDFDWFKITRDELSSLKIDVLENFYDIQRGIVIKIAEGSHSEEIRITQVTSQGYEFQEIKYSLKAESTFTKGDGSPKLIYNNYTEEESPIGMYPFKSARETSTFESDDEGAFIWASEEGIEVEVPVHSNQKYFYKKATTSHLSQLDDITFTVVAPSKKQLKVTVDLDYLEQIYSYTLILINNRTQEEKEIKGEWIIRKPISYKETLELDELPEK